MSKTAMFGGSFNPVHNGHIRLLKTMIEHFSLDKVYVVPTAVTPLKDNSAMVSARDRFEMCRLAFSDIERVEVSDIELGRSGKSYTVDTLSTLVSLEPCSELHLIVGADSFFQLPLWHRVEDIFRLAHIITVSRCELDYDALSERADEYRRKYGARCDIIASPVSELSSTIVRDTIKIGGDISGYVPVSVARYIKENKLYGCDKYGD